MMKKIVSIVIVLSAFSTGTAFAQAPSWDVNPSGYASQANLTGVIHLDNALHGGANDLIAAFSGNEVRGVASPIFIGGKYLFFLTVYSNAVTGKIEFKYYDSQSGIIREVVESVTFSDGGIWGSAASPFILNVYEDYDFTPVLSAIPDQAIEIGGGFAQINLADYTTLKDDNDVLYSHSGSTHFNFSITDSIVSIIPINSSWTGYEDIAFIITDDTPAGLWSADTLRLTVLPVDLPPIVNAIPDQVVYADQQFPQFNLSSYLTMQDDDEVQWDHRFLAANKNESPPGWTFDPSPFPSHMNLIVRVLSGNSLIGAGDHLLAAFNGAGIAGIAYPTDASGEQLFFLTVYSDAVADTITFQFYDGGNNELLPVFEKTAFVPNGVLGSSSNPYRLRAGHLVVDIDGSSTVTIRRVDPEWRGQMQMEFTAKENTGKSLSDTAQIAIVVSDDAPVPVELISFTASAKGSGVELQWRTATEVNNHGFAVERKKIDNGKLTIENWKQVSFVEGAGNSNSPKTYSFIDASAKGKLSYRLKQIDSDGKFSYSQEVEVNVGRVPKVFALEQNYPNPFNPSTTIGFTLQTSGMTTLKVYDIIGREVATLVNEHLEAGVYHQRIFSAKGGSDSDGNASNLASGIYFVRLQSEKKQMIRKMLLVK